MLVRIVDFELTIDENQVMKGPTGRGDDSDEARSENHVGGNNK